MKFVTFLFSALLVCFTSGFAFSQAASSDEVLSTKISALTEVYSLDKEQVSDMDKIMRRYYRAVEDILSIKQADPDVYFTKRTNLLAGTQASMLMILREDQKTAYVEQTVVYRNKRLNMEKELKAQGKDPKQIQIALAEIEF